VTIELLPGPTNVYAVDVGYIDSRTLRFIRLATFGVPSYGTLGVAGAAIAEAKRRWPEHKLCWQDVRLLKSEERP
jgi:hypothetical protein